MKHMHHIIPKHMGGTDDSDNLVELTIEEHADAHKKLYEHYGLWQDYLAWQGLSGMMDKQELIRQMLSIAGREGARKANITRGCKNDGLASRPWKRSSEYAADVDGRKVRSKRYWFNDGITEGQYSLTEHPEGWSRGRLKSVMKKTNPFVQL